VLAECACLFEGVGYGARAVRASRPHEASSNRRSWPSTSEKCLWFGRVTATAQIVVSRARAYSRWPPMMVDADVRRLATPICAKKAESVLFVSTGNEFSACPVPERAVKRIRAVYIERAVETRQRQTVKLRDRARRAARQWSASGPCDAKTPVIRRSRSRPRLSKARALGRGCSPAAPCSPRHMVVRSSSKRTCGRGGRHGRRFVFSSLRL
jgi:hypothetical protein